MTKLTQQEIEQERVRFENWFLEYYWSGLDYGFLRGPNVYENNVINLHWIVWLARAELAKGE